MSLQNNSRQNHRSTLTATHTPLASSSADTPVAKSISLAAALRSPNVDVTTA